MSILSVANVHFESAGSNRIDYIAANDEVNIITTGSKLNFTGNLNFTKTGTRITGDFSNATIANRVMFQTSTLNSATSVGIIPNGTASVSTLILNSSSDPANSSTIVLRSGADNSQAGIYASQSGTGSYLPMTFYTGGSERARIDTSGNVAIGGVTSPGAKLDIQTTSGIATTLRWFQSGVTNYDWRIPASTDAFAIYYGGTAERMRIDSSGNVGIGNTAPGSKLTVAGTIESTTGGVKFPDGSTQTSAGATTGKAIAMAIVFG